MSGAYYSDEHVTLYHGDCLALLPGMADASVAHVITDPPYEAEAHTKARRVKARGCAGAEWGGRDGREARVAELPFAPISDAERDEVGRHIGRLAARWSLVFCQIEAAMRWRAAVESGGARYKRACIWTKPDGQPQLSGDRPGMGYETIVAAHALGRSRWNGGGRLGVFTFPKSENGSVAKHPHPTTKPLALMRTLVTLFTDPDDVILDPFAGSGTTGLAARMEGRRAILIEREERYAEVAAKRLERMPRESETGQRSLFAEVGT